MKTLERDGFLFPSTVRAPFSYLFELRDVDWTMAFEPKMLITMTPISSVSSTLPGHLVAMTPYSFSPPSNDIQFENESSYWMVNQVRLLFSSILITLPYGFATFMTRALSVYE